LGDGSIQPNSDWKFFSQKLADNYLEFGYPEYKYT